VKPHSSRLDLSVYPHKVEIQTRFADVDPLWHLNNVRLLELYQEGRTSFNLAIWEGLNLDPRTHRLLVASQSIDYLHEVEWPDSVTVGIGIARLGNKSYTLGLGMFQRGKCVGVSNTVLVYATDVGPAPLPERLRGALKAKMLPEAEQSA
jgi:acyl-CoA thioester hydrolase